MSMAKSLCCLETFDGTSRSGPVTELSVDILLVCRRPLILSLLESCGNDFAFFFCCCCGEFLSFRNLVVAVCVDGGLPLAGISTRCVVAFIGGVEVLDTVPVAGKPASHTSWSCQFLQQALYCPHCSLCCVNTCQIHTTIIN